MAAHPLRKELLPAVAVLGQRRIGVLFLQRDDVGGTLFVGVVDTGRTGVEKALASRILGGHQQMRVNQHGQHAKGFVVLNEAHSAHVGGQIVDFARAIASRAARGQVLQVENHVLDLFVHLIPFLEGLDIDRAQVRITLLAEVGQQMAANKAAAAGDQNQLVLGHDQTRVQ
jgi:hypothetical protein